ncbi:HAMP domain-containing sensor histidine kinase [Bdellovibrionota bacterium FG-1]
MFFAKSDWGGIRVRLTALFVVIFGITLVAFSALVFRVFTLNLQSEFDADLFNHALDVAQGIDVDFFGELSVNSDVFSAGEKIFPFSVGNAFFQISTLDGRMIARSRSLGRAELPRIARDLRFVQAQGAVFRTLAPQQVPALSEGRRNKTAPYRLLTYLVQKPEGVNFLLQIAVPMTLVEQQSKGLITFFLIMVPLTLILAAFGGLYFSQRALAPVVAMIHKAQSLSPASLGDRIPVPVARDEIQKLALTLNGLLDRLQAAFESQERFVADASHQLKTPLAILRGELDLLQHRKSSVGETEAFLTSASQELEHLSRMVEDLLLLARVDAGEAALQCQPVRLDEVALEAVSRLERLARSRGVHVRFDLNVEHGAPDFEVSADSDLLQSLLQCLIENAIKYSTVVIVSVSSEADWLWVRVRDEGPGIAAEHLERIFERFYRISGSLAGGTGLGLAIAKRIAEAHRGILLAESEPGKGSVFSFGMKRLKKI